MWLPLALADILAVLIAIVRAWSTNPEKIAIPMRSETLAGWCLPMMAASLKAGEEEQEALEMLRSVQILKAKQDAKARANK